MKRFLIEDDDKNLFAIRLKKLNTVALHKFSDDLYRIFLTYYNQKESNVLYFRGDNSKRTSQETFDKIKAAMTEAANKIKSQNI